MARKSSVIDKMKQHKEAYEAGKKSQRFFADWPADLVAMAHEAVEAVRSGSVQLPNMEVARFIVSEVRGKVKRLPCVDTVARWVSQSLHGMQK